MPFSVMVAVLGWLCLGLEYGLTGRLDLPIGTVPATASVVVPLAVFIALCAPPQQALWTGLALGLGLDLITPRPTVDGQITVLGPHALGMFLAVQFVLASRGWVMRRNPLATAALSIPTAGIMHVTVTAIFTVRHWYDGVLVWEAMGQLAARAVGSFMTGVSGLVLGVLLMPLAPALGLALGQQRHYPRR